MFPALAFFARSAAGCHGQAWEAERARRSKNAGPLPEVQAAGAAAAAAAEVLYQRVPGVLAVVEPDEATGNYRLLEDLGTKGEPRQAQKIGVRRPALAWPAQAVVAAAAAAAAPSPRNTPPPLVRLGGLTNGGLATDHRSGTYCGQPSPAMPLLCLRGSEPTAAQLMCASFAAAATGRVRCCVRRTKMCGSAGTARGTRAGRPCPAARTR